MARPDTWMPFYGKDYQDDTGHCSAVERGAYMDLLWACWTRRNSLPTDDAQLMRLARCTPAEWRQARVTVMAFFYRDGDVYRHKRVAVELAIATARFDAKVKAGATGAAKRWHRHSTAIAEPSVSQRQTDAQPQPHSPNGETDAYASGAKRPKATKGTRLALDWQPSSETREHAGKLNLTPDETGAVISEFAEYFRGPDATRPVKKDWDSACRRWITRAAPGVIARRPRSGQARGNRPGVGSVFAALGANLEAGNLDGQGDAGHGLGWGTDGGGVDAGSVGSGQAGSPTDGGPIIDADDWRRVPEGVGEDAVHDESPQRINGGHSADADVLRGGTAEVPRGRGAGGAGDTGQRLTVVAGVERVEGPARRAHGEAQALARSVDARPALPEALRRQTAVV